jgi:hypothetical protein
MLHGLLSLDRGSDILVTFDPDQPVQAVTFGEPLGDTLAMFANAADQIARY